MRALPFGTIALCVVAAGFYGVLLAGIPVAERGDAVVGEAIGQLYMMAGLWLTLTGLLIGGGIIGRMPRLAAFSWVPLLPLSAVAAFVGVDICTWRISWPIIFPVFLPVLIMLYALWARFPRIHDRFPAAATSGTILGAIFVMSIAALIVASS